MVLLMQFIISAVLGIASWLIGAGFGMEGHSAAVLGLIVFLLCMGCLVVITGDDLF